MKYNFERTEEELRYLEKEYLQRASNIIKELLIVMRPVGVTSISIQLDNFEPYGVNETAFVHFEDGTLISNEVGTDMIGVLSEEVYVPKRDEEETESGS